MLHSFVDSIINKYIESVLSFLPQIDLSQNCDFFSLLYLSTNWSIGLELSLHNNIFLPLYFASTCNLTSNISIFGDQIICTSKSFID